MKRNIVLIGMRGAGKSTIGKQLAQMLHMEFVDTDTEIEHRMQMSIREIFARHGESRFREVEEEVVCERLDGSGAVIALGGGAIESKRIRSMLALQALVVELYADEAELVRRIESSNRPALTTLGTVEEVRTKYAMRMPLYRRVAHCGFSTSTFDTMEVCHGIEHVWRIVLHNHLR